MKIIKTLTALLGLSTILFLSSVADAAKENFDRSKPPLTLSVSITDEGGKDLFVHVSGLQGPGVDTPTDEERIKRPGSTKYSNITLKRGYTGSTDLQDWAIKATTKGDECRECFRNITIKMLSPSGEVVRTFNVFDAFPVKWNINTETDTGDSTLIETLEVRVNRWESV